MSNVMTFRREAWGLEKVLFAVQMPEPLYRAQIFAAREKEMDRAAMTVMDAPRNVLVSGLFGIGKTFFLEELLRRLREDYNEDVLTVYACLETQDADIPTTILRGLADALSEENKDAYEIAQSLHGFELTWQEADKRGGSGEIGVPNVVKIGGSADTTTTSTWKRGMVADAAYQARILIERAMKERPERRLIFALDDLDKRDPATIREALVTARPLLHSDCAFLLTGHPLGVLRNIYSTAGGTFDQQLQLEPLPPADLRTIMERYLHAGRVAGTNYSGLHPFTEEAANIIIAVSRGIPRLLNRICQHILQVAAEMRKPIVDADILRECWEIAGRELKDSMREDVARLVEVLQAQTDGFDPLNIPDSLYDQLGVDSNQALLSKINVAIYGDYAVGIEVDGKPRITADPLLIPPPTVL
jgi:hypothetical protein